MIRIILAVTLMLLAPLAWPGDWKNIRPGFDYRYISPHLIPTTASSIYGFRVDLKQYRLQLISARQLKMTSAFANEYVDKTGALLAINGGFFSPQMKALGLRLQAGQVLNPMRGVSWWGVFYVNSADNAAVMPMKSFKLTKDIQFAIQAGPRLLVNGQKLKLTPGLDLRSALCVDNQQRVIIAITNNLPMTTDQFADVLLKFGCVDALNLDGGTSSQLYAHVDKLKLNIENYRPVADAVAVFPR